MELITLLDALKSYLPLFVLIGGGVVWLTVLQFRILALGERVRDAEAKADQAQLAQQQFQLSVTDRLARIETAVNTGIRELEATIREALRK